MHHNVRRLLILALLLAFLTPASLLIPHYGAIYSGLEKYYAQGLWVGWHGAYVLANLCTPGFMQGASSKSDYAKNGPRKIVALYLSVMMTTFCALAAVLFGLWCFGMMMVLFWASVLWLADAILPG